MSTDDADSGELPTPDVPEGHQMSYRAKRLKNGLRILLITDNSKIQDDDAENSDSDDADNEEPSGQHSSGRDDDRNSEGSADNENDGQTDAALGGNVSTEDEEKVDNDDDLGTAAASLCVCVGCLRDPKDIPGLAHFLEHSHSLFIPECREPSPSSSSPSPWSLFYNRGWTSKIAELGPERNEVVFMGCTKYPKPNDFDLYLKKHGGSCNATTNLRTTVFQFEIQWKFLAEALERFAQFFISPLFVPESMMEEAEIVDQEWKQAYHRDRNRIEQLMASMAKPDHPMRNFTWGNAETLIDGPKQQNIDLNGRLRDFFNDHYLAQNMTLVVWSKDSLDKLEEMVTSSYEGIRGSSTTCPGLDPDDFSKDGAPFETDEFRKMYRVVPVKDVKQLQLSWALPSQMNDYRSRPTTYIAFLLGHEGKNGVLSLLKKRNLGLFINCGVREATDQENNRCWTCFSVHIGLTDQGLQRVSEVVNYVYEYLELLRQQKPDADIYNEILDVDINELNFMETPPEPIEYVKDLAVNMHKYELKDIITAHYLQMIDFEPNKIVSTLDLLGVDNVNLIVLSKSFSSECDLVERWYGTKYSVQDIPAEWREMWEAATPSRGLRLPDTNYYIAEDFELKAPQGQVIDPKLSRALVTDVRCELWHHQDTKLEFPRASINFYLKSVHTTKSAEHKAMTEMYVRLLQHHLNEICYPAEVARLSYTIQSLDYGIGLKLYGFSHKLPRLFKTIVDAIAAFEDDMSAEVFATVKNELDRSYRNISISPSLFNRDLSQALIRSDFWTAVDRRCGLQAVTITELRHFIDDFYDGMFVEGLVEGNITAHEASQLLSYLLDTLDIYEPYYNESLTTNVTHLPTGTSIFSVRNMNPEDGNSVITNYYQHEERAGIKEQLLNELMVTMMEEPCFNVLRTKYHLSYSPTCERRSLFNVMGFAITLSFTASHFSMQRVDKLIESFLTDFNAQCQNLTDTQFEEIKGTLLVTKEGEDTTLSGEVSRHWREIVGHTYHFSKLAAEAKALKLITAKEFKEFCREHLLSSSERRKLSVCVVGHNKPVKRQPRGGLLPDLNEDSDTPLADSMDTTPALDTAVQSDLGFDPQQPSDDNEQTRDDCLGSVTPASLTEQAQVQDSTQDAGSSAVPEEDAAHAVSVEKSEEADMEQQPSVPCALVPAVSAASLTSEDHRITDIHDFKKNCLVYRISIYSSGS